MERWWSGLLGGLGTALAPLKPSLPPPQLGIDDELVELLGRWSPIPVAYAGGARTLVRGQLQGELSYCPGCWRGDQMRTACLPPALL